MSFEGENEEGEGLVEEFGRRLFIWFYKVEKNERSSSTNQKINATFT